MELKDIVGKKYKSQYREMLEGGHLNKYSILDDESIVNMNEDVSEYRYDLYKLMKLAHRKFCLLDNYYKEKLEELYEKDCSEAFPEIAYYDHLNDLNKKEFISYFYLDELEVYNYEYGFKWEECILSSSDLYLDIKALLEFNFENYKSWTESYLPEWIAMRGIKQKFLKKEDNHGA